MNSKAMGIIYSAILPAILLSCGGEKPGFPSTRIGRYCTVQFRRDALGAAMDVPISPETSSMNGAEVMLSGKLVAADSEGVTLLAPVAPGHPKETERWIPMNSILLIQFEPEPKR